MKYKDIDEAIEVKRIDLKHLVKSNYPGCNIADIAFNKYLINTIPDQADRAFIIVDGTLNPLDIKIRIWMNPELIFTKKKELFFLTFLGEYIKLKFNNVEVFKKSLLQTFTFKQSEFEILNFPTLPYSIHTTSINRAIHELINSSVFENYIRDHIKDIPCMSENDHENFLAKNALSDINLITYVDTWIVYIMAHIEREGYSKFIKKLCDDFFIEPAVLKFWLKAEIRAMVNVNVQNRRGRLL